MAAFKKMKPKEHYAIVHPETGDTIGWMWGFVAIPRKDWPLGAKAFVSMNDDALADTAVD